MTQSPDLRSCSFETRVVGHAFAQAVFRRVMELGPRYLVIDAFPAPGVSERAESARVALEARRKGRRFGTPVYVAPDDRVLVEEFCLFAPYSALAEVGRTGPLDLIVSGVDGERVELSITAVEASRIGLEIPARGSAGPRGRG